ncbi:ornithine cyclodeaminase family protein [Streptomyces sp. NBC_01420]|uniref:ornithine cyclodeaminase family protein n=1 Tax=Streptomyces sp. NBC_01420 TaxID=2903858 RepID=UPI00324B8B9F
MPVLLLNDDDVRARLDAPTAVRAVRSALLAAHEGGLHAPPRVHADLGDGDLVFTAGHLRTEKLFGFRAYDTLVGAEQLVAVWGTEDGRLRAVVHGDELGPRRTGAIGAVAVDTAARPGPIRLGLVGTGTQAWTQLWAIRSVRQVDEVTVASRRPERAEAFARRAADELGVAARAVRTVEEAVRGHDVVVVATNSAVPVLDADWISPGTHVTTLGPKTVVRHEVPSALADLADVLFTDSPAQAAGYGEPHIFPAERMVGLGALLSGAAPGRTSPEQITVFCSVGLAGTEVAVAAALYEAARSSG